jgi:hypothetical protein
MKGSTHPPPQLVRDPVELSEETLTRFPHEEKVVLP